MLPGIGYANLEKFFFQTRRYKTVTLTVLKPFGLVVHANKPLFELPIDNIRQWTAKHRVVVLRDVETPTDNQILEFCGRLGEVLEWEFGAFNELKVDTDAKNYLYTNRQVPMHWDGAFVGRVPQLIFFYCQEATGNLDAGGETTFCDSVDLVARLSEIERQHLGQLEVTYSTDKVVHYGGSFTSPLIIPHPRTGEPTLRYAEPVADLNPIHVHVVGLPASEQETLMAELKQKLYAPSRLYAHTWRTGDIVLADNHALLHGRNAFQSVTRRHLRRVNIL